ncbi:ABC transporter permease [Tabrizicola sp.]|uniref:ABC transporter permease n=1 Tax=Tabrizicola sp. TaxID=2005166 RepID=UPI002732C8BB|nr:ABC transporter permease [Tabrizicola sp.]MDP3197211.1 ABC transporter permease [Tabrizicola sp.]MDZ4069979.1 ABC transporter permease [Tabrizicola sp.]
MKGKPEVPPRRGLIARFRVDAFWFRQRGAALSFATLTLMVALLGVTVPGTFFSAVNLSNLAAQLAPLFLVSLGQTFVLLGAGFDLSVGAVISLSSAILTLDMADPVKIPIAFAAAAAVGLVNGWGCVHLRVHPIIMTLATSSIVQGFALLLLPTPGGVAPQVLVQMASGTFLGLPVGLYWIIAATAAAIWLVHGTTFGVQLYATGQNPQAAWMTGIKAPRIRVMAYVISSLMAALAGAYLTGRLASGDPNVGSALGLDSVLGAVLGGTLLSGGVGGPIGTVAGVLIIGLMNNGLNLANVSPYYQFVVKGVLLVTAVSLFRRKEAGL